MNPKIAIYAASFDPLTNGHWNIIKQCYSLEFDKIHLVIGRNPNKKSLFLEQERLEMIGDQLLLDSSIDSTKFIVSIMNNKYLFNYANEIGANIIVRGLRNTNDLEFEQLLHDYNLSQDNCKLQHLYLMTPQSLRNVSSSFVKGLIGYVGWKKQIYKYVPTHVANAILRKYK